MMYETFHDIPFDDMSKLVKIADKAKESFIRLPFSLESFTEAVRLDISNQFLERSMVDENGDEDDREIMQYWLVRSAVYAKALKDIGEPLAEIDNAIIWGRRTIGIELMNDYAFMRCVAVVSGKLKI